jgi:hypothetical protein
VGLSSKTDFLACQGRAVDNISVREHFNRWQSKRL